MSEDNQPPELAAENIDASLSELYANMLDINADAMKGIRQQIKNIEVIREAYLIQVERCGEIISLLAAGAAVIAENTGDLLLTEFGFEKSYPEAEEEEDDEDS